MTLVAVDEGVAGCAYIFGPFLLASGARMSELHDELEILFGFLELVLELENLLVGFGCHVAGEPVVLEQDKVVLFDLGQ